MSTPAKTKARTLAECEAVIERGLKSFLEVGHALAEIQGKALYLEHYDSFEVYCAERWDFTRQRAFQLTEAAEVADLVSTTVDAKSPQSERVARPLVALKSNPDLLRQTWSAIGNVSEKPTAELVTAVVSRAKVAIAAADRDLSEFLATIVEQELAKIEAEKVRKAANAEPRQPALPAPPKPAHFVLFDVLHALTQFPEPEQMLKQVPWDCWGRLDNLDAATDYLVELRSRWSAERDAANARLVG